MTDDAYRIVTTTFRGVSPSGAAIFVDKPHGGQVAIPRSLISGADDRKFDKLAEGEEVSFRVFDWKAEECGFA